MRRRAFLTGLAAAFAPVPAPLVAAAPTEWAERVAYTSAELDQIALAVAAYWAKKQREMFLRAIAEMSQ